MDSGDMVGFDLCAMASCDHAAFMLGTFGLWGALLAGGDVVVAKGFSYDYPSEEDEIYLMEAMPGWLYVDVRNETTAVLKIDEETISRKFVAKPS